MTPLDFGAIDHPEANNIEAVKACLRESARTGQTIADERQFTVNGSVRVDHLLGPHIGHLRLKQTGAIENTRTLFLLDCQGVRIDFLEIDRGEDAQSGVMNEAAGFMLNGGEDHDIRQLEVHGAGLGSGIAILRTRNSRYAGLYAHHMHFSDPGAWDDRLMGILLLGNTACEVEKPKAHDLTGDALSHAEFPNKWTRGIALSSNERVRLYGPEVHRVDQGIDVTGSQGNIECEIIGGRSHDCDTYGVKLANSAVRCKVSDYSSKDCGLAPFVISGPCEPDQPHETRDNEFTNCTGINAGSNRIGIGIPAAFRVMEAAAGFAKGTRFRDCKAIDEQTDPSMQYGFHSEAPPEHDNTHERCMSIGHIAAPFGGTFTPIQQPKPKRGCLGW